MSELQWDNRTCEGSSSDWGAEIFNMSEVNKDQNIVVQGCFIPKIISMGILHHLFYTQGLTLSEYL